MAGHIFLISCLLAICLPIIFVQLPRFATIKELHAETETEKRSAVLRRQPLSPSRTREILRRITRPWSETSVDITSTDSEQEQSSSKEAAHTSGGRQWCSSLPRPIFQGDACADGGCSSKEEDELRKARAGKKPWGSSFRRQLPRTELVRKSPGGRWHAVTDASPPHKMGRDLEARGLAKRLFPPDPVPEMNDGSEYDPYSVASSGTVQTPQEPLHRRPPPKNQSQSHDKKAGPSREQESKPLLPPSVPPQQTDPESLPSPLDGSPLSSMCYLPRSALPTETKEPARCPCRHCRHPRSESPVPQAPSVPSVAPKEPFPLGGSPFCHTCPHTYHCHAPKSSPPSKGREIPMSCEYPDSAPTDALPKSVPPQRLQDDTKAVSQETPEKGDQEAAKETAEKGTGKKDSAKKDIAKETSKEAPKASSKEPRTGMPHWQVLLVTMGLIIFVFAFAILIAHCLAWFLVYKTEARLGEVRSGLLRGGEMKLCLCGRG